MALATALEIAAPVEMTTAPISIGASEYFAGFMRDLTIQKQNELMLKQRVEELDVAQRQNTAMSELAGFLHASTSREEIFAVIRQFAANEPSGPSTP